MSDTRISKTSQEGNPQRDKGEVSFIFFLTKAQKVATALYLITGLWSEREPLRFELRKKAVALMSDMRGLSNHPIKNEAVVRSANAHLEHILSLLDLSSRTGSVSLMNAAYLTKEIQAFMNDLSESVRERAQKLEESNLSLSLRELDRPDLTRPVFLSNHLTSISKRQIKGHPSAIIQRGPNGFIGRAVGAQAVMNSLQGHQENQAGNSGKDRKEKILKVIAQKGSLTIKDIAQVVPEYSEKTIQRDLVEMVTGGKVKKKGERRWTIYFV